MIYEQVVRRKNRLGLSVSMKLAAFLSVAFLWSAVASAVVVNSYTELETYTQDATTESISFGSTIGTSSGTTSTLQFGASKTINLNSCQFGHAESEGIELSGTLADIVFKENSGNAGFLFKKIDLTGLSEGSLTMDEMQFTNAQGLTILASQITGDVTLKNSTVSSTGEQAHFDLNSEAGFVNLSGSTINVSGTNETKYGETANFGNVDLTNSTTATIGGTLSILSGKTVTVNNSKLSVKDVAFGNSGSRLVLSSGGTFSTEGDFQLSQISVAVDSTTNGNTLNVDGTLNIDGTYTLDKSATNLNAITAGELYITEEDSSLSVTDGSTVTAYGMNTDSAVTHFLLNVVGSESTLTISQKDSDTATGSVNLVGDNLKGEIGVSDGGELSIANDLIAVWNDSDSSICVLDNDSSLTVGGKTSLTYKAGGLLTVADSATATFNDLAIYGTVVNLNATDDGKLTVNGDLTFGSAVLLRLENNGELNVSKDLKLGSNVEFASLTDGSTGGTLSVGGKLTLGTKLIVSDDSQVSTLTLGSTLKFDDGSLIVDGGKTVSLDSIATEDGKSATVEVHSESKLEVSGDTKLGSTSGGNVSVLVDSGSTFSTGGDFTAYLQNDDEITITDDNSTLTVTGDGKLVVADDATAKLNIVDSATATFGSLLFGGGTTILNLQDSGTLKVTEDLTLDSHVQFATLEEDHPGGSIDVDGKLTLGQQLNVAGVGNSMVNSLSAGTLNFNDGSLIVSDGLTVNIGSGGLTMEDNTSALIQLSGRSTLSVSGGAALGKKADDDVEINLTDRSTMSLSSAAVLGALNGGHVNVSVDKGSSLNASDALTINLQDGDSISVQGMDSGKNASSISAGTLNVTANNGTAAINVTDGAKMTSSGDASLTSTTKGTLDINVAGVTNSGAVTSSTLSADGTMTIGGTGTTNLNLGKAISSTSDGAKISANELIVGSNTGTTNIKMAGANTSLTTTSSDMTIGQKGNTTVTINDGAALDSAASLILGDDASSKVTMSGSDANITADGLFTVGNSGDATVTLQDTTIEAAGLAIGQGTSSDSSLNISGNGTKVTINALTGEAPAALGTGSLTISDVTYNPKDTTADPSLVEIKQGGGIYLNGNATISNSRVKFTSDDTSEASVGAISTGSGTASFTNQSVLSGKGAFYGNVSFDKTSSYEATLNSDFTGDSLSVTDGNITLNDATLKVLFADSSKFVTGTWEDVLTVNATNTTDKGKYTIDGKWSLASDIPFYNLTAVYADDKQSMDLKVDLNKTYFEDRAAAQNLGQNERAVSEFLDIYPDTWYGSLVQLAEASDTEYAQATRQLSGAIFANSLALARQSLWVPTLDRISWSSSNRAYLGPQNPYSPNGKDSSIWFQAGYNNRKADNTSQTEGYESKGFNLSVGIDRVFETYLAGGAFFHYGSPEMTQEYASAEAKNYSAGFYMGYKMFAGLELKGMAAYTYSDMSMRRNIAFFNTVAVADSKANSLTASVELNRPFFFGAFVLRPTVAFDTENVWMNRTSEREAGIYALNYAKANQSWHFMRFGGSFELAPMDMLLLKGRAFYAMQLNDPQGTVTGYYAQQEQPVTFVSSDPGKNYFNLGVTGQLSLNPKKTVLLYSTYDGYFGDGIKSHYIDAGLQISY